MAWDRGHGRRLRLRRADDHWRARRLWEWALRIRLLILVRDMRLPSRTVVAMWCLMRIICRRMAIGRVGIRVVHRRLRRLVAPRMVLAVSRRLVVHRHVVGGHVRGLTGPGRHVMVHHDAGDGGGAPRRRRVAGRLRPGLPSVAGREKLRRTA